MTYYHEVHNSYGRASIRLDKKELVNFSWIEMYHQEWVISELHESEPSLSYDGIKNALKSQCDANCTYCNYDFIDAVLKFINLSINDALLSDNYIIKLLAVLDRRTGKRTLKQLKESYEYLNYPEWFSFFINCDLNWRKFKLTKNWPYSHYGQINFT